MVLDRNPWAEFLGMQNSRNTTETYNVAIVNFVNFFGDAIDARWQDVTRNDVIRWKTWLLATYKVATASTYWDGAQSFFAYMQQMGLIASNPFSGVKKPKRVTDQQRIIPGEGSVQELLRSAGTVSNDPETNLRNRAIVGLLANGLRVSEVVALDTDKLYVAKDEKPFPVYALLVRGKGNKERVVPLNFPVAFLPLESYLAERGVTGTDPDIPMFTTQQGSRVSVRLIQHMFATVVKHANLAHMGYSPHSLRHNYATRMIRSGVGLPQVQKLLGHRNPATTAIYLHLDAEDVILASKMDKLYNP